MIHQKFIALLLLFLEAAAFSYFTRTTAFPLAVAVIVLLGSLPNRPLRIDPSRRSGITIFLALCFVIKRIMYPYDVPGEFIASSIAYVIAQFFLSFQALQFLSRGEDERVPQGLPLAGIVVMIGMADINASDTQSAVYQGCAFAFVVLAALFHAGSRVVAGNAPPIGRRFRTAASVIVLGATLVCGGIGSQLLQRYWRDLEMLFERFQIVSQTGYQSRTGFSRQSQLGSVQFTKTQQEQSAALRIYSSSAPGYLRGAAYDQYHAANWQMLSELRPISRSQLQNPAIAPDPRISSYFVVAAAPFRKWRTFEVWPDIQNNDVLFAPLNTALYSAAIEAILLDSNQIAHAPELSPGQPFKAYATATRAPIESPPPYDYLTTVPDSLDPRVRKLAEKIFANCRTDREKLDAVQEYFRREYEYHLGIEIPPGVDPLNHFLLERPPAHCEYFASGATMLLRLAGIPCRYMTGFVATERNPYGGYWIARNRDAHAWAEAYVEPDGWTIVEATPDVGIPQMGASSAPQYLWDDFRFRFQIIRTHLAQGTWLGLVAASKALLSALFTTLPGWLITAGIIYVLGRAALRGAFGRTGRGREIAEHVELNRLLSRMDRLLKPIRLVRGPSETLHQFATRIRNSQGEDPALGEAANWYVRYAEFRYRGASDVLDISTLQRELASLSRDGLATIRPAVRESVSPR